MSRYIVHTSAVNGPATHAIIIGVGRYPHLNGGDGPPSARAEGMGQLTSPPISARKVATWLIKSLNYPAKPLANVALLLSEPSPRAFRNPLTGHDHAVAEANIDAIEEALTEWRELGDRSEDERVLFFFCGHGMGRGSDLTLIAADYGSKPAHPLDGALDFGYFKQAMDDCAAREQIYFVDACRVGTASLLEAGTNNGRTIFQQGISDVARTRPRQAWIAYSSLPGSEAFGRQNDTSSYTAALLEALAGSGADDNDNGRWLVTSGRIKEALDFFVGRMAPQGRVQVPASEDPGRLVISIPKSKPKGVAVVVCDPPEATAIASLECRAGARVAARRGPQPGEWVVSLRAGSYDFVADFPGGQFRRSRIRDLHVRPVYREITLAATAR